MTPDESPALPPAAPSPAPAPAPAPASAPSYRRPFRRYQQLALDAFEATRKDDRRRCYVVMPPGSGKTVVGLEIARRLGRQTVVFGPNTAIQAQWVQQWGDFGPERPAGTSPSLTARLTALTYQSLCSLDHGGELDELAGVPEEDEPTALETAAASNDAGGRRRADGNGLAERRRRRKLIVHGGDHAALLGLLHPNGRALIERMKSGTEITIVLDECHHLLEMWGHLIEAVIEEIGPKVFVVGLTATPPGEMGAREAELYDRLFGRADFEVVTPAVVKEGELAPYQELAYLTQPLPGELEYMAAQSRRFDDLTAALLNPDFASRPFIDWLHQRVVERGTRSGAQVGWDRFELDEPDLALATLRLFVAMGFKTPDGAHIGERHRQPPTADDWVSMMADYSGGFLEHSPDPRDAAALGQIRRALPSVGYLLTRGGIRSYVSPVDRLLALSASKGVAAQTILDLEQKELGPDLRALILCDFERAGIELLADLRSVLDPQAGSASLILQLLVADAATRALDPILLSGRTVACSGKTAASLIEWCGREVPEIAAALGEMTLGAVLPDDIVVIAPEATWWQPRNYVPLITRYFEGGQSRCLVGTRGLLGEGWDAHSVNVLIDLTAAATATSVHQMRGRSLRLDPRLPHKVADNWDVVCVAPNHTKGAADYARFVRKHHAYYALTAAGEIECGVSHVDPILSPFGPPPETEMAALNGRTLARIARREDSYAQWGIGQPYRNAETETVRIHFERSLGLPGRAVAGSGASGASADPWTRLALGGALGGTVWLGVAAASVPFVLLGVAVCGALFAWTGARTLFRVRSVRPTDTLEGIAWAVVFALADTGGIDKRLTPAALRIVVQSDGYYRCYLDGATRADSRLFAESLDQVLSPLEDPRYIIPRRVVERPDGPRDSFVRVLRTAIGRPGGRLIYHAVPDFLAARQERVKVFENAWRKYVSGGRALFYRDPVAQGILAVAIGENPFETTSQMRTLWS